MPKYKKGEVWNKPKNSLMLRFEKETGKNAIYRGKVTGQFEYWIWREANKTAEIFRKHDELTENTTNKQKIKPKPKAKPKSKPKRQVIDKKQKRIGEIQREVDWINENIKSKEDSIDKKVEERRKYYNDLLEKEDNTKIRRQIYNKLSKIRREYQDEIWKLQQKRDKEQAKVIAVNLNFNKINKLVKDNFRKSKYSASHQVRGYGESSTGYEIVRPTLHDPYIIIKWFVYWSVSTENREKSTKKFKDKLKLILRENNIKFTEDEDSIIIGK